MYLCPELFPLTATVSHLVYLISQSQNINWCLAKGKTSRIWMVIVLDRNSLERFFSGVTNLRKQFCIKCSIWFCVHDEQRTDHLESWRFTPATFSLNLSAWLISHGTIFFSHNKSANSTFQPDFSVKRTRQSLILAEHLENKLNWKKINVTFSGYT